MENTILPLYASRNIAIRDAKGSYVYDVTGRRYIDMEAGVWCANLGFGHEGVNQEIHKQVDKVIHHGYKFTNKYCEELSEKLLSLLGLFGGQSVFLSSGSEAVNLAISLAKHLTERDTIVSIGNTYLSAYGHGQYKTHDPYNIRLQIDDLEALEAIDFSKIAAFALEPGTSMGTVRFPSVQMIQRISEKLIESGGLFVVDEVTTGCGRTGKWFGYQHYPVQPDIVATGKGLGNGYPVSGVSVSASVAEQLKSKPIRYAQSHQNDPLGCVIGLEVLQCLKKDNLIERSMEMGDFFKKALKALMDKHSAIREVRGRGLLLAIEVGEDVHIGALEDYLFSSGFLVGLSGNNLRFLPPLTIEKQDIDELIAALDRYFLEYNR